MSDPKTTAKPPRLTAAQRDVLLNMLRPGERRIANPRYQPVVKLLALGLIEGHPQKFGSLVINLTPEGVRVRKAYANG